MSDSALEPITLNGLTLQHLHRGAGTPLLMLHGWGASSKLLWPLAERLIPLGYAVYIPDLPGHGASPEPPQAWTVFDYARLVVAYLDAMQLERVHLFGHSFGGRLGLILGSDFAPRLHKMALADSAGVLPRKPFWAQARLHAYKAVRDGLKRLGAGSLAEQLRHAYNARYGSSDFNASSGTLRQTFINVVNQDLLPHAARIAVPTLLFWGDKDEDTPLWQGRKLEQTIPDAGMIVHAGAGHYSYLERAAETARVMDYFFRHD